VDTAELIGLLIVVSLAATGWTLWSANAGRKTARWGRRKARKALVLVLLVTTAAILVVNST